MQIVKNEDFNHEQFLNLYQSQILYQNNQQCQPIKFQNCKQFVKYNQCEICNNGYYIQDGQCYRYPESRVQNCKEYVSKEICYECLDGFYLDMNFMCVQNQNILNCEKYSPFQHERSKCIECKKGHYIFDGKCIVRYNNIEFCEIYTKNEDNCERCIQGYLIDDFGERCQIEISNCLKYVKDSYELQCVQCKNEYYLNEQSCQKGTVKYCLTYYLDADICQTCQKNYFLRQNQCMKIREVSNCLEYDEQNQCLKCKERHLLLRQKTSCKNVNLIVACLEYVDQDNCLKCEIGYYLTTDKKCEQIPKEMSCLKLDSNKICIKCQEGYLLNNKKCEKIAEVQKQGCLRSNEDKIENIKDYQCVLCRENYLPIIQKDMFFCQEKTPLDENLYIENCQNYQKFDDMYQCLQCEQGYVLLNDKCILQQKCEDTIVFQQQNLDNNKIQSVRVCKKFLEGCKYANEVQDSQNTIKCIQCKQGYIQIVQHEKNDNHLDILDSQQDSPLIYKPFVQCIQQNLVVQLITNCEYYIQKNNTYYCQRCQFGYVGQIQKNQDFTYLVECKQSDQCLSEYEQGINPTLNIYLSCHKCAIQSKTLFLKVIFDQITKQITQYSYDQDDNQQNIYCDDYKHVLPLYCSIGSISFKDKNKQYNCLSCKPGFYPIKETVTSDIISKCEQIENCLESQWQNQCSKCKPEFSWLYIDGQVRFDKCIKSEIDCMVQHEEQSIGCLSCKKGFYLLNGKCFQIQLDDCESTDFVNQFESKNLNLLLIKSIFFSGCQQCQSRNINVLTQYHNGKYLCLLKTNEQQLTDFCVNYFIDEESIKCESCSQKRIPNLKQDKCLNIQSENCKIINEYTNTCHKCKDDWVVSNGICETPQIQACLQYENNTYQGKQECLLCIPGYFLENGICQKIEIENCVKLDTRNQCEKCQDNYILSYTLNKNFCIAKIKDSQCLSFEPIQSSYLVCNQCNFGHFLQHYEENVCLPIDNNRFCLEYSLQDNFVICIRCDQGYQLIQNECIYLSEDFQHCELFVNNQEQCKKCKSGYYLDNSQKCVSNPSGIPYCEIYISHDVCQKCQTGYYLIKNVCKKSQAFLENCQYYKNDQECLECQKQYYNKKGICIQTELKDCKIYIDENNCRECEEGYYIINHFNNKICRKIQVDEYCLLIENKYPYRCQRCVENYYPLENACFKVEKLQENCVYYDENQNCQVCAQDFYLSKDKDCLSYLNTQYEFDRNCEITKEIDPECLICNLGYFVKQGKCIKCKVENCGICSSNKSELCLICLPNHTMYKNQCIQNENLEEIQIQLLKNKTSCLLYFSFYIFIFLLI